MKKLNKITLMLLTAVIALVLTSDLSKAQWTSSSSGMGNQTIYTMMMQGSTIFAGTNDTGLYRTTDQGVFWSHISGIPRNQYVWGSVSNNQYVYVGTNGNGIYRSTNSGATFTQSNAGLTSFNPRAFVVKDNNVFAAFWSGNVIYKSSNNGIDWLPAGNANGSFMEMMLVGNTLYAAAWGNGVYKSTNDGVNWININSGLGSNAVACIASKGNDIYAGTTGGYYKSTNGGTNWTICNQGVTGTPSDLLILPTTTFACTSSGVFRTTNDGITWTQINTGLSNTNVYQLLSDNTYLYAGTSSSGVFKRPLSEVINSVNQISSNVPEGFSISQNYPNPFNPTTKIKFDLRTSENVKLVVFDAVGKEVATLVNEKLGAGSYEADFDGANLTSGIYFYKISAGSFNSVKKMMLVK